MESSKHNTIIVRKHRKTLEEIAGCVHVHGAEPTGEAEQKRKAPGHAVEEGEAAASSLSAGGAASTVEDAANEGSAATVEPQTVRVPLFTGINSASVLSYETWSDHEH